jgi:hypothetical protein
LLKLVPRPEGGAALESAADVAAAAGFAASEGLTANRAARLPFGLGASLPSVSTAARPRPVSGGPSMRQLMPWAAVRSTGVGSTSVGSSGVRSTAQQRHVAAQSLAAGPCGAPAQPKPGNKSIKQYPQTTRIAAGDSYAKGPHPARDPV